MIQIKKKLMPTDDDYLYHRKQVYGDAWYNARISTLDIVSETIDERILSPLEDEL